MADIATSWNAAAGCGDWVLVPADLSFLTDENGANITDDASAPISDGFSSMGEIVVGNDLGTAILISLFTDRVADPDDAIPDGSGDPRGWWGDLGADRAIGSKIWLRLRSKQTDVVPALVKSDIEAALAWLVDDGVCTRLDITVAWQRPGMLGAQVVAFRTDGGRAAIAFDWAWREV